ncbi:hypothetical protein HYV22_01455 [Candidatus Gottesmanbacteria bacterium]|nr:hypothetical protein [Candidatus Gottesmanbacteria bacterium]
MTSLRQYQATDTPLGREFRDRVLAMVQEIDTSKLPADQQQARQAFDALKQKMIEIRPLPQPEIKPQNTELFKFLQGQPSSEQTTFLIQAMENGAPTEQVIRAALERPEFKTVAAELQKTLFPNGIPQIAEQLLQAAGIDGTKENLKTMEGILHPKDKLTLKKLGNYLFIALVIMMLSSRMLTPMIQESEGQSSGGH